jgi:hypothetical protein
MLHIPNPLIRNEGVGSSSLSCGTNNFNDLARDEFQAGFARVTLGVTTLGPKPATPWQLLGCC